MGPSFRRKNRLSAVRPRKKTSDERRFTPPATPSSSAVTPPLTAEEASSLAVSAAWASTPRSVIRPAGDAAYHDEHDHNDQDDERHEHQRRAESSREPVPLQPSDQRRCDRG